MVSVGIRLKGYPNTSLSLHDVPTICEPIACQPITASVEADDHLMSLDLADSADGSAILIGCDHYWDLVTGKISEGAHCDLHQTRLGVVWPCHLSPPNTFLILRRDYPPPSSG